MRSWLIAISILFLSAPATAADPAPTIPALAWHDIVEKRGADPFAVTREEFEAQIAWLKEAGYTPIRLSDLEDFRSGRRRLPTRPVLLTFDDGLRSYRDVALPILRRHGFPSVLAIVTGWHDGEKLPAAYQGRLLGWAELRQIAKGRDVEIISHSHNLHRSIPSNPQGNRAPAGVTRRYEQATVRYEDEAAFRDRIRHDLETTKRRFEQELGYAPVAIAWPYGQYDRVLVDEAARLGMHWHLTLDATPTTPAALPRVNRTTFLRYRRIRQFEEALTHREYRRQQQRFALLTLDDFAGKSAAEQERLLSTLLTRLQLMRVNTVIIDPFTADRRRAFFSNAQLPVAADVLNRLLHQLKARLEIHHLVLRLPPRPPAADWRSLYTELARLNRFSAVVVDGATDPRRHAALLELLRYYHPDLRVGTWPGANAAPDADFSLLVLNPALGERVLEDQANGHARRHPRAWVLLESRAPLVEERLVQALRALRRAGVAHYGVTIDAMPANPPALIRLVPELVAHTVIPGEGG
jgi:biofilm PGA synthesis lipoprotein PgaB